MPETLTFETRRPDLYELAPFHNLQTGWLHRMQLARVRRLLGGFVVHYQMPAFY